MLFLRKNRGTGWQRWTLAFAMAVLPGLLVLPQQASAHSAAKHSKVTKCGATISSCGCTITKPGFYQVTANLSYTQGLNADGACLDVKASKVVLSTSQCTNGSDCIHYAMIGPGGATPTGIGLHILKSSNNDFIDMGIPPGVPSTIVNTFSGWDVGLLVEGNSNIVENFSAYENGTAGVELNKAKGNNINQFVSYDNANYGVWLRQSRNNQVNCGGFQSNGNIEIYVGCSTDGPVSAKCKGVGPSTGNQIYDLGLYIGNSSPIPNYGIAIDLGDVGNIVTDSYEHGNSTNDVYDANSGCGTNQWFFNEFSSSNKSCIQ